MMQVNAIKILPKEGLDRVVKNTGVLWADCFSEKPMFRYLFQEDSPEERYQKMLWTMERKAKLSTRYLQAKVIDGGVKGSTFWFKPYQKPGFPPLQLAKVGLIWVPVKFGMKVFKRINTVSLHEIEAYEKHRKPHMWIIDGLAVSPHHQRQGIGSRLVNDALDEIDKKGDGVFVLTHNPENIDFYQKLGFKLVDELPIKNSDVIGYCFLRN